MPRSYEVTPAGPIMSDGRQIRMEATPARAGTRGYEPSRRTPDRVTLREGSGTSIGALPESQRRAGHDDPGARLGCRDRRRSGRDAQGARRPMTTSAARILAACRILDPTLFPPQRLGHHPLAPVHGRRRLAAELARAVARDPSRLRRPARCGRSTTSASPSRSPKRHAGSASGVPPRTASPSMPPRTTDSDRSPRAALRGPARSAAEPNTGVLDCPGEDAQGRRDSHGRFSDRRRLLGRIELARRAPPVARSRSPRRSATARSTPPLPRPRQLIQGGQPRRVRRSDRRRRRPQARGPMRRSRVADDPSRRRRHLAEPR